MKLKAILILFAILISTDLIAQPDIERTFPPDLIKNERFDTCKVWEHKGDTIRLQKVFSFDNNGNEIFSEWNNVKQHYRIIYNSKNQKIAQYTYGPSEDESRRDTFLYDASGNMIDNDVFHIDGRLIYTLVFKYANGFVQSQTNIENGDTTMRVNISYSDSNRLRSSDTKAKEPEQQGAEYRRYDRNGNEIEYAGYYKIMGYTFKHLMTYDKFNHKIKTEYYSAGQLTGSTIYTYYDTGLIKSEQDFEMKNEKLIPNSLYTYEYTSRK